MTTSNSLSSHIPHILVVDDMVDNRDLLRIVLEAEGYHVDTAPEGYSAISKIEQSPPDLILLDLMMPDLDGPGVIEWLIQNNPSILSCW